MSGALDSSIFSSHCFSSVACGGGKFGSWMRPFLNLRQLRLQLRLLRHACHHRRRRRDDHEIEDAPPQVASVMHGAQGPFHHPRHGLRVVLAAAAAALPFFPFALPPPCVAPWLPCEPTFGASIPQGPWPRTSAPAAGAGWGGGNSLPAFDTNFGNLRAGHLSLSHTFARRI